MKWWTDCCHQLLPGFKTPGCGSHNSAGHQHLCPSHAIAGTLTPRIKIAVKAEISVLAEAANLADQNRALQHGLNQSLFCWISADIAISLWKNTIFPMENPCTSSGKTQYYLLRLREDWRTCRTACQPVALHLTLFFFKEGALPVSLSLALRNSGLQAFS